MKDLLRRMQQPTPPFFRKVRSIGLAVAAVGASLLAAPVALPLVLVKVAGYLTVAGGVITAVSQATVPEQEP